MGDYVYAMLAPSKMKTVIVNGVETPAAALAFAFKPYSCFGNGPALNDLAYARLAARERFWYGKELPRFVVQTSKGGKFEEGQTVYYWTHTNLDALDGAYGPGLAVGVLVRTGKAWTVQFTDRDEIEKQIARFTAMAAAEGGRSRLVDGAKLALAVREWNPTTPAPAIDYLGNVATDTQDRVILSPKELDRMYAN